MNHSNHRLPLVLLEENMPLPIACSVRNGRAAVFSRRSPAKEPTPEQTGEAGPNQDAALIVGLDGETSLLAVADGCGGMAAGEKASRTIIETLQRHVEASDPKSDSLRASILDSIEQSNRKICAMGIGAATTVAVVEIQQKKIRTYHVGDSCVLLVGNRGKRKLQTVAHSPVGYAVESGMLSEEEAIRHEERHLVSNVVGASDTHTQIGGWQEMSKRDTLLIGSDGVFDNLYVDEIVEIIRKGPLEQAAQRLAETCLERMCTISEDKPSKQDDLTFILFRLTG